MKRFLTFALACFPLMCFGAPSISYTTYFNNTHTYTNSTTAGTNSASRGVFTNSLSAAGFTTSGTTNATLTGNLLANGATFTNGITSGASTFTGAVGFADGAAATPSITFASETGTGFSRSTASVMDASVAGDRKFRFSTDLRIKSDVAFGWSSGAVSTALDTILVRDGAANTLALRNGANAQTFNVYGTYTDASNYQRIFVGHSGGDAWVVTSGAGTGSPGLNFKVGTVGAVALRLITANTLRWDVSSGGHFLAATDNTYDIGASGATRPRNVYVGTDINLGGSVLAGANARVAATGLFYWDTRARVTSPANSIVLLQNAAQNDFDRLQFGGTSASFPSLKRSTTNLVVRLADDSANTGLEANVLISRINATSAAAPTIASATTIAPTNSIVFISGTDAIETITAPAPISATGGQITLIPTGIFTTTTAGNIALASTAVVSKALIMTYDSGTTKWYPSY